MIAIIDYKAGNLTSVARAVAHLGVACAITHDRRQIRDAERIIFPGVGAAGAAMGSLKREGLDAVLREQFEGGKPILGICIGMQVALDYSEENDTPCLGLIAGRVCAFPSRLTGEDGRPLKIPHMGWNRIALRAPHPLTAGIDPQDQFYFVHGYYPQPENDAGVLATTDYGISFPAIIECRNLAATQFHPEKSGRPGLRLLANFCHWKPVI
jgi:glutamine amidotransferase